MIDPRTKPGRYWLAAGLLAASQTTLAGALEVRPYVEYGTTYNNNLLTVPNARARSETIRKASIGTLVDWPVSRQRLIASGQVSRFRYRRYDQLDHSEYEGRATWEFQFGHAVYGALGYRRERYLDDFDNRQRAITDFIDVSEPTLETYVQVHPDYRIRTLVSHLRLDHSLAEQSRFDREQTQARVELQYQGVPDSVFGFGGETIDGRFPGRVSTDPLSPTFTQNSVFATFDWEYSGISRIQGQLGYTERDAGTRDDRDFGGMTGRLAYIRTLSAKTHVTLELSRFIYSVDDVDANFVRDTGGRLVLDWDYSPKLALNASLGRREQVYQTLGADLARSDTVDELAAEMIYRPLRQFSVTATAAYTQRDSNVASENYDAVSGGLSFRWSPNPENR
ncbi:outer membrane beta-barrel protein [Salinisphaera sp. T31B1]|uniref:outer membrane beta-barrel protein n=1 Tax=Salinisphaera sp. T31B1 TaxID=727963 RepID=UPI003341CB4B